MEAEREIFVEWRAACSHARFPLKAAAAAKLHRANRLERTKKFVKFVGGVEVRFEFAGGELFAKIIEAAGKEVQRRGEIFFVGKDDVAPGGVRTAGEAQGIAQAGAGQRDRKAIFVQMIIQK